MEYAAAARTVNLMNVGKEYHRQQNYETVVVHACDYYCPTMTFIFYSVEVITTYNGKHTSGHFSLYQLYFWETEDKSVCYRCASD